MRYIIMTAGVSTARPSLKNIVTVKDRDNDDDCLDFILDQTCLDHCLDFILDQTCLDHWLDVTITQYQKLEVKVKRKDNVRKIVVEA